MTGGPCSSQVLALMEKLKSRVENLSCEQQAFKRPTLLVIEAAQAMQESEDWALTAVQQFALTTLRGLETNLSNVCPQSESERPNADQLYKQLKNLISDMEDGPAKEEKIIFFTDMESKLKSDEFAYEVRAQFEQQDVNKNGSLELVEFTPVA